MITRTVGASNAPLNNAPSNQGSQRLLTVNLSIRVARHEMATVDEIADDLKVFVDPNHVVHLRALDVHETGLTVAGYFDFGHLHDLAAAAIDLSHRAKGVYFTLNPLHHQLLSRITNCVSRVAKGECATNVDVVRRRWFYVDVDAVRLGGISATDEEKEKAIVVASAVRSYLKMCGWPDPVIADSGNGRALFYRIDLPTEDNVLVRNVLRSLSQAFSTPAAKVDTSTHDAIRLCRVPGTLNRKGDPSVDRPHRVCRLLDIPDEFNLVSEDLLRQVAMPAKSQPQPQPQASHQANSDTLMRAAKYIFQIPPAISGQGGDPLTFKVACHLVLGFGLTPEEAFPILSQWNLNCQPPWPDTELRRKLERANNEGGERGYLNRAKTLRQERKPTSPNAEVPEGQSKDLICQDSSENSSDLAPPYSISIPDFMQIDLRSILLPSSRSVGREPYLGTAVHALAFWAMIVQGCSRVVLPDVAIAEALWGPRPWPTNWRNTLSRKFRRSTCEGVGAYACPHKCPLHGTGVLHQHFVFNNSEQFNGALETFVIARDEQVRWYNFAPRPNELTEEERKCLKELRKSGILGQVHFPTALFARSPKVGMSYSQRRLVYGMTRELTRVKQRCITRNDHAQVVVNGVVPDGSGGQTICPLLDRDAQYVGFNGNGRRQGCGYTIIGDTLGGWLARCGYADEELELEPIICMGRWLADLQDIADRFRLTIAAWHSRRQEWIGRHDLNGLLRSESGRAWLNDCSVRIYAPENYAFLWRQYYASRLGFSEIPGGATVAKISHQSASRHWNRTQTLAWLAEEGLNRVDLAEHLGCTKSWVSMQLTGSKRWSQSFARAVEAIALKLARNG